MLFEADLQTGCEHVYMHFLWNLFSHGFLWKKKAPENKNTSWSALNLLHNMRMLHLDVTHMHVSKVWFKLYST